MNILKYVGNKLFHKSYFNTYFKHRSFINCQHPLDHQKSKRFPEKHLLLPY